ncbi:hypothetical protein ACIGXM_05660 [Kitasatospora sp. NPDC052896]|uniref:hypothetical protein n=1 Tax=Kitasatospora sp. NPDC052896 TaxID=3364061 RepID=UPI0037C8F63F
MDAEEALRLAAGARRAAVRNRRPGWYPLVSGGLCGLGQVALGVALLPEEAHRSWRLALIGVGAVAWVVGFGLMGRFAMAGGVVPRLQNRSNARRWRDNAPSLVATTLGIVVWAIAGLPWMLIVWGITGGAAEWYRLARLGRPEC